MIGKTLGSYRIVGELGRGAMGEVYRAEDLQLGREVAIKVLSDVWAKDRSALTRFRREARSLASLHHPNVASIFGFEEIDEQNILIMELVEGRELTSLIRQGNLAPEQIRSITRDVARGLAEAHRSGIVHRDLKPGNIKVTPDGTAKILDFGLALNIEDTQITRVGTSVGTVAYMSPEQARGELADPRSDVYSLGVIVYEMLSGHRPHDAENGAALVHAIANTAEVPAVPGDSAEDLGAVVGRCLQPKREDRFENASRILEVLEPEPGSSPPLEVTGTRPSPNRRLLWALLAVLLVGAAGVAISQRKSPGEGASPAPETAVKDRSLVVLPFRNLSGDPKLDWLEAAVPELITASLAREGEYDVISSQRTQLILEQNPSSDGTLPLDAMAAAGVGLAIRGSIFQAETTLRIQSELLSTGTATILDNASVDGPGTDALFEIVAGLGTQFRKFLAIRAISEQSGVKWIQESITYSVDAYRAYARGRRHMEMSEFQTAADFFLEAVTIDSTFVSAWADISACYWNLDNEEKMRWALGKAQALRDRASLRERIWLDLYGAIIDADGPRIIQYATELLDHEPEDRFVRYLLGKGYYNSEQYAEAIEVWRPLQEQDWGWIWTWLYGASSLWETGSPEEALDLLDRAEGHFPSGDSLKRAYWLVYRGRALAQLHRWEDALEQYDAAARIRPEFGWIDVYRAEAYLGAGDKAKARAELEGYLDGGNDLNLGERAREILETME